MLPQNRPIPHQSIKSASYQGHPEYSAIRCSRKRQTRCLMSREKFLNKIVTYMGGRSAEEVILNTVTSGAENDIEAATAIARAMVTRYGMSEKFDMMALETINNPYLGTDVTSLVSNETSAKIDDEVLRIIKFAHEKAKEIIKENLPKMHELAKYLLEKETMTGEEFMEMLMKEE